MRENGYSTRFQKSCKQRSDNNNNTLTNDREVARNTNRFATIPYVQGISERVGRILQHQGIKVAYKPIARLSNIFSKPKDKRDKLHTTGIVYKLPCKDCEFVYYGQTQRSLKTRAREHQRACAKNDKNSKVAQHANKESHTFDFEGISIVDKEINWHKRVFLEAWHSISDPMSGNEHIQIPSSYKSLMTTL